MEQEAAWMVGMTRSYICLEWADRSTHMAESLKWGSPQKAVTG